MNPFVKGSWYLNIKSRKILAPDIDGFLPLLCFLVGQTKWSFLSLISDGETLSATYLESSLWLTPWTSMSDSRYSSATTLATLSASRLGNSWQQSAPRNSLRSLSDSRTVPLSDSSMMTSSGPGFWFGWVGELFGGVGDGGSGGVGGGGGDGDVRSKFPLVWCWPTHPLPFWLGGEGPWEIIPLGFSLLLLFSG